MSKTIAEVGDIISWEYNNKIYISEVAIVDVEERHYGVYADYGQDLIEFDCAKIEMKTKQNEKTDTKIHRAACAFKRE